MSETSAIAQRLEHLDPMVYDSEAHGLLFPPRQLPFSKRVGQRPWNKVVDEECGLGDEAGGWFLSG